MHSASVFCVNYVILKKQHEKFCSTTILHNVEFLQNALIGNNWNDIILSAL